MCWAPLAVSPRRGLSPSSRLNRGKLRLRERGRPRNPGDKSLVPTGGGDRDVASRGPLWAVWDARPRSTEMLSPECPVVDGTDAGGAELGEEAAELSAPTERQRAGGGRQCWLWHCPCSGAPNPRGPACCPVAQTTSSDPTTCSAISF
jgi:hypothetical protein